MNTQLLKVATSRTFVALALLAAPVMMTLGAAAVSHADSNSCDHHQ